MRIIYLTLHEGTLGHHVDQPNSIIKPREREERSCLYLDEVQPFEATHFMLVEDRREIPPYVLHVSEELPEPSLGIGWDSLVFPIGLLGEALKVWEQVELQAELDYQEEKARKRGWIP